MVYESKKIDIEKICEVVKENELGVMCVKKSDNDSMLDFLAQKPFGEFINIRSQNNSAAIMIAKVSYNSSVDGSNIAYVRGSAFQTLFYRWCKKGFNKHHASDPYNSKAFMKYVDDLGFTKSDYIIFGKEE